jgi:hypothetical protein
MQIVQVPIEKAGSDVFLEVDIQSIHPDVWDMVVMAGLKAMLNDGKSKLTGLTKMADDEKAKAHAESLAISQKNLAAMVAGSTKPKRGLKAKDDTTLPREVQTEARRIARDKIKDKIRAAGGVPSHYKPADITKYADALIKADPAIVAQAKANVAATKAVAVPTEFKIEGLSADPEKLAKAETKKAESAAKKAAKPISAKQAGMTTKRSKPGAKPATTADKDNEAFLAALKAERAPSHATH